MIYQKHHNTFPNAKGTGASIKEDKPHLSPLSRTSHTPSAQHRKSHSSTPFPWFRHPGPTLKRPLHSLSVQDISSPACLWPKGRCAALHWRPSVLHGSPAVCLSSSQDSTHHLPLQCQAAGWCPCPRHTQILEQEKVTVRRASNLLFSKGVDCVKTQEWKFSTCCTVSDGSDKNPASQFCVRQSVTHLLKTFFPYLKTF